MFVYVMDIVHRDKLLQMGYQLVKADESNGVWCFENKQDTLMFELDFPCVVSDILTF